MESFLREKLRSLSERGLLRDSGDRGRAQATAAARRLCLPMIDAATNDYYSLASEELAATPSRVGAGAARLVHGTDPRHLTLEHTLADWVGLPSALVFPSAFAANVGLLQALVSPDDHVVSARANHASLIDGIRLSKARTTIVDALDPTEMRAALGAPSPGRRWLVLESYYSMDGVSPDLVAARGAADEYGAALIVDEAHALGVFGPHGGGLCREAGIVPDALTGGFGKAIGTQGGFVAGTDQLREVLWNCARPFVFSTGTSPALAEVTRLHVERLKHSPELRQRLLDNSRRLRSSLEVAGLPLVAGSHGPIVAVVAGSEERAMRAAHACREQGILVQAIRPPTVPENGSRLRIAVKADFDEEALRRIVSAVEAAWDES